MLELHSLDRRDSVQSVPARVRGRVVRPSQVPLRPADAGVHIARTARRSGTSVVQEVSGPRDRTMIWRLASDDDGERAVGR